MTNISYEDKTFQPQTRKIIDQANEICAEYAQQGYDLTLRQVFYQFVARDLLPNTHRSYKRLGSIIADARLAGLLSWDYITDRTRNLSAPASWESPAEILQAAAQSYRRDRWAGQSRFVECWVEKEALAGVVGRSAAALDVAHFSCRGYVSQSEMWRAGQRILSYLSGPDAAEQVIILHLGDHDPSGLDMTRDIRDRLFTFVGSHLAAYMPGKKCSRTGFEAIVQVRRIALNVDQIEEHDPPPNPAKISDSRAPHYISRHGASSWELDALPPDVLDNLIRSEISAHLDHDLYDEVRRREESERRHLQSYAGEWSAQAP